MLAVYSIRQTFSTIIEWKKKIKEFSYLTKETTSPCKEVSEERSPDRAAASADLGDNLELVSRLEMESRVAFGDPCGVAAVCVMMGADGGSKKADPLSDESRDRGMFTDGGGQSRIVSLFSNKNPAINRKKCN